MQTKIISGAFDLSETRVETITTPIDKVFSVSIDALIDKALVDEMRAKGYSRLPVYYGDNKMFILGILIVKTLIGVDIKNPKTLRDLCKHQLCKIKTPSYVHPYAPMGQMLNTFKSGSTHMAIVCNDPQQMVDEADKVLDAIKRGTDM